MSHCRIWHKCILGFVRWVYFYKLHMECLGCLIHTNNVHDKHLTHLYCDCHLPLTHWGLNKMASIMQMTFSNAVSFKKGFHEVLFQLTIGQYNGSAKNFVPKGKQAITWTKDDPMLHICITKPQCVNSLRPRQNGRHFADDIFKCIFLNENVWISIKISLKFVPKGPINNIPALVQIMAWRCSGDKPLSEAMVVNLPTHIFVSQPWAMS